MLLCRASNGAARSSSRYSNAGWSARAANCGATAQVEAALAADCRLVSAVLRRGDVPVLHVSAVDVASKATRNCETRQLAHNFLQHCHPCLNNNTFCARAQATTMMRRCSVASAGNTRAHHVPNVEKDDVLGLEGHKRAKVRADDAVPSRALLLVELLLDQLGHVLPMADVALQFEREQG